jgi:hypothetical protein
LASGYYKELQQMVEQTLALPLSGYLVQTQIVATDSAASWENVLSRQPQPTWWQTTVSLPWWLQQQPALKTNLSTWQLVQTLWVVRDAADAHVTIKDADPSLFFTQDGMTVADTAALDPLVAETFASGDGNSPTISVVVKNATNVTGLASMVARYVKHLGGEVIAVEASDSGQANSSVKSETRTNFSDNMSALVGVPFTPTPRTGRERADAELIVGIDMLNRVGEPSIPAKP